LALASITAGPSRVVNISTAEIGYSTYALSVSRDQQMPLRHARISEPCFTTEIRDITPKTTEQNLVVRINKSEAEVTNNKRLRSMYCTIEDNY